MPFGVCCLASKEKSAFQWTGNSPLGRRASCVHIAVRSALSWSPGLGSGVATGRFSATGRLRRGNAAGLEVEPMQEPVEDGGHDDCNDDKESGAGEKRIERGEDFSG